MSCTSEITFSIISLHPKTKQKKNQQQMVKVIRPIKPKMRTTHPRENDLRNWLGWIWQTVGTYEKFLPALSYRAYT